MAASPRLELVFPARVEVSIDDDSESNFFAGLSGDPIDDGGVFIATWRPLAIGAEVELHLDLPSGDATLRGFVKWRRDASCGATPGYGVALDATDDETRARVEDFCAARAPLLIEIE